MDEKIICAVKPVNTRQFWIRKMCLLAVCWAAVPPLAAYAQTAERVVVQAPSNAAKGRHLHINFGVTDMAYRQQVLVLTPLGSSYDEVKRFTQNEWAFQGTKLPFSYKTDRVRLYPSVYPVSSGPFTVGMRDLMREEPPHIEIANLEDPFAARPDRRYMEPTFLHRPLFWRSVIEVQVYYVFDEQHKLIDAFASSYVHRPVSM